MNWIKDTERERKKRKKKSRRKMSRRKEEKYVKWKSKTDE